MHYNDVLVFLNKNAGVHFGLVMSIHDAQFLTLVCIELGALGWDVSSGFGFFITWFVTDCLVLVIHHIC
jgi:hypothetical protein